MTSVREQAAWWFRGASHSRRLQEATDGHIRDLQAQVASLEVVVAGLSETVDDLARRFDALPREMRAAVDDLGGRIGALHERWEQSGG